MAQLGLYIWFQWW